MPLTDEDAASQAIATLNALSEEQKTAQAAINAILTDGEPFVDVHELFRHYNVLYFRSLLLPRVEVLWSPRLTLCAGICELTKDPSTGKYTRIRVKLSTPLLQYRPRTDTINTLLHEAIHAYFFITTSWQHSRGDDGTGHGEGFQYLADAINNHGGYEVTIYHTFHDEVDSYRTHIWKCDGPCQKIPPYFGLVKRSMNRAPGKGDSWWADHQASCNGAFTKISEPEPTKKQLQSLSKKERAGRQKNKIDSWITTKSKDDTVGNREGSTFQLKAKLDQPREGETSRGRGKSRKATETIVIDDVVQLPTAAISSTAGQKRSRIEDDDKLLKVEKRLLVECPVCSVRIAEPDINAHLDVVHGL